MISGVSMIGVSDFCGNTGKLVLVSVDIREVLLDTWKLCKTARLSSTRALSFHNVAFVLVFRPIFSAMICYGKQKD